MEVVFRDNRLIGKEERRYNLAVKLAEALSRRNLRYRIFGFQAPDQSIAAEFGAFRHFQRSLNDGEDLSRVKAKLNLLPFLAVPSIIGRRSFKASCCRQGDSINRREGC